MCGIGLLYPLNVEKALQLLNMLMTRGRDAAGYAIVDPDSGLVSYHTGSVENVRRSLREERSGDFLIVLHARARPLTEEANVAQPVLWRGVLVSMEGIVENDWEFRSSDAPSPWIDAYALCRVFETQIEDATISGLEKVVGSFSCIAINLSRPDVVNIVKGSQPLVFSLSEGSLAVASEDWMLIRLGIRNVTVPEPGTYIRISIRDSRQSIRRFRLTTSAPVPEPSEDKAVVLCSGGLDSGVVACIAKRRHRKVYLLFVDYGQPAAAREREAVHKIAEKIGAEVIEVKLPNLLNVEGLKTQVEGPEAAETLRRWVPARNLLLLSIAVAVAEQVGASVVYTGFNLEEACVFPDNTTEAIQLLDRAAKLFVSHGRVPIVAPLARLMKRDIVRLAIKYGILDLTYSCDRPDGPCGRCEGCWLRQRALEEVMREAK